MLGRYSGTAAVLTGILAWSVLAAPEARADWVKAASATGANWAGHSKASDLDPASYASDQINKGDCWGNPLVLTFTGSDPAKPRYPASRVRFNADRWDGAVDKVKVKVVFADGEAIEKEFYAKNGDAVVGENAPDGYPNAAFKEITFDKKVVSQVEFSFHYTKAGYYFWLYELQIFEEVPPIGQPSGVTLDPSAITAVSAVLHGRVEKDGGAPCTAVFEYGTTPECDGGVKAATGTFGSGGEAVAQIAGLQTGRLYYYRLKVTNPAGSTVPSAVGVKTFVACPEESEDGVLWTAPVAIGADTGAQWETPGAAFDDWDASAARCYHIIHDPELWSPYLHLSPRQPGLYSGLRFKAAKPDSYIDKIQIDILTSGGWRPLYDPGSDGQGGIVFEHNQFTTVAFKDVPGLDSAYHLYPILDCRIRFHMATAGVGQYWNLYEFDFRQIGVNLIAPGVPYHGEEEPGVCLLAKATGAPLTVRFGSGVETLNTGTVSITKSGKAGVFLDPECTQQLDQLVYDLAVVADRAAFASRILNRTLYVTGAARSEARNDSSVACFLGNFGTSVSDRVNYTAAELELLRGKLEVASGRGMKGGAREVLELLPEDASIPASSPVPVIAVTAKNVGNVRLNAAKRLIVDVDLSGTVQYPVADMIDGDAANPSEVVIEVAAETSVSAPLAVVPEPKCLLRPYAKSFTWAKRITDVPVDKGRMPIVIRCAEPVFGNAAYLRLTFTVKAVNEPTRPTTDLCAASFGSILDHNLVQPLAVQLNFGTARSVAQLVGAGPNGIGVRAHDTWRTPRKTFDTTAGFVAEQDKLARIASTPAGSIEIVLTDVSGLTFDDTKRDFFVATLYIPALWQEAKDRPTVKFVETGDSTNVFETETVSATMRLVANLDVDKKDDIEVDLARIRFDGTTQAEILKATLAETENASRIFKNQDETVSVSIARQTGVLGSIAAQLLLKVSSTELGLSERLVDVGARTDKVLVLDSGSVLKGLGSVACPGYHDYADAWLKGPWAVTEAREDGASRHGPYVPVLVRLAGPVSLSQCGAMSVDVFGKEVPLVEFEGELFAAGSPVPGNYVVAGHLQTGDSFGAGKITKKEGFVFAAMKDSATGRSLGKKQLIVYNSVSSLYDRLRTVAANRRLGRLGNDPGKSYCPAYTTDGQDDPLLRFVDQIVFFQDLAKVQKGGSPTDPVTPGVRLQAAFVMSKPVAGVDIVVPNSPTTLLTRCGSQKVWAPGAKNLLSHWKPESSDGEGAERDPRARTQNWTQIAHFNLALGYARVKSSIDTMVAVLEASYPSDEARALAIVDAIRKIGYLDVLSEDQKAQLAKYGDKIAFDYVIQDSVQLKEMVDVVTMARRFQGMGEIEPFNFFLAYDIVSNEGFNIFGIDSLNDVIATQAGFTFGVHYREPASTMGSRASLKAAVEEHMATARMKLRAHPVMDKAKTVPAFLSVQSAVRDNRFVKLTVYAPTAPDGLDVWPETIGTAMQAIEVPLAKLIKNEGTDKDFIDALVAHVGDITMRKTPFDQTIKGLRFQLSAEQTLVLFDVVEVLMFIDE